MPLTTSVTEHGGSFCDLLMLLTTFLRTFGRFSSAVDFQLMCFAPLPLFCFTSLRLLFSQTTLTLTKQFHLPVLIL